MNTVKFLYKSKIAKNLEELRELERLVEWLTRPESLYRINLACEYNLPAITFIAKDLEKTFEGSIIFPSKAKTKEKNALLKQNLGRIFKLTLEDFGYSIKQTGTRVRVPSIAESKYFTTFSIYERKQCVRPLNFDIRLYID